MPGSHIYTDSLQYIDAVCVAYIGENVAAMALAIAPFAWGLLGGYLALYGLKLWTNTIDEPLGDFIVRIIKIGLILQIGIGLWEYNTFVVDVFFHGPEQLAGVLTHSGSAGNTMHSLDQIVDQGFAVGKSFWDRAGLLSGDIGSYGMGGAVWVSTIAVTAYAFFLIVLAKVATTVIVVFGPLFILSLMFQPTAGFFNAWVQQLVNFFLVHVLVIATSVLIMTLFSRAAVAALAGDGTKIDVLFPFFILAFACFLFLATVLAIAAGLAGSVGLSSFGVGRMAARFFAGAASRPAVAAGRLTGRGAAALGRNAGRGAAAAFRRRPRNSVSPAGSIGLTSKPT